MSYISRVNLAHLLALSLPALDRHVKDLFPKLPKTVDLTLTQMMDVSLRCAFPPKGYPSTEAIDFVTVCLRGECSHGIPDNSIEVLKVTCATTQSVKTYRDAIALIESLHKKSTGDTLTP